MFSIDDIRKQGENLQRAFRDNNEYEAARGIAEFVESLEGKQAEIDAVLLLQKLGYFVSAPPKQHIRSGGFVNVAGSFSGNPCGSITDHREP